MNRQSSTSKGPGRLVETKDGKKGRTYNSKGMINEKIPVYLETEPHQYSDKAILCDPIGLKIVGFVD